MRFAVTPRNLARSMAIEARDSCDDDRHPPADLLSMGCVNCVRLVSQMGQREALHDLKTNFGTYGRASWPDDYPQDAYQAALNQAKAWDESGGAS